MALQHDLPLISTLAASLSVAFVFGLAAAKLRLSPIVGYLLAGIVIGPHTPGFVANPSIAEELSEIGIVLLMFGVGLHFSLRDLMSVKNIAIPGALVQMLTATALGTGIALWWGWSLQSGLLLGLALSVASTVVMLRELEASRLLDSSTGRIAVGWLIVEDLAVVLALVLLPVLAGQNSSDGPVSWEDWVPLALVAIGKTVLFIAFMLIAGKRLFPWIIRLVVGTGSRELFTLSVIAVAVGVAYAGAVLFQISFALGAFFAGMMIKESDFSDRIAAKALPFQDAFAVLFFVSVGMLFDPMILTQRPLQIAVIVGTIIIGKSIAAYAIVRLFRHPRQSALLVAASLAQIGEFSFILANLGLAYDLLPPEGHSLILAGALISIALNPVVFRLAHRMEQKI